MELLTCTEFAARFNVSRQMVLKYIASGRLKAEKIDGIYFIPASELENVPQPWKCGKKGRWAIKECREILSNDIR